MWQEQAKHCPLCSAPLAAARIGGRERMRCSSCPFVLYTNPASAAAGVVLDRRGQVLLVRRRIEPYRGHWALPAGYQEVDEEPRQTVLREVREEAGVEVEVLGLLDLIFVPDDPRRPANVSVFLCRSVSGQPVPGSEETEAAWFSLDRLPEPIGFDNYRRILKRLRAVDRYPESAWSLVRGILRAGGPAGARDGQRPGGRPGSEA